MEADDENQVALLKEYHQTLDLEVYSSELNQYNKKRHHKKERARITKLFKDRGLRFRYGRWTKQEKKLMHENFTNYILENEEIIGDPVDFVKAAKDQNRRMEVHSLMKDTQFYIKLAAGLFREMKYVIYNAHPTLDPLAVSNGQRYSNEDLYRLKSNVEEYVLKHGESWDYVAEQMERSVISCRSAYRNFFMHKDYKKEKPNRKQQRKLIKLIEKLHPNVDITCELVYKTPWNEVADKIGHHHGKFLQDFWDKCIKRRREDGKVIMIENDIPKPPEKLVRKLVRDVARRRPTHLDALDWNYYYKMLSSHFGGVARMKKFYMHLLRKYRISPDLIGLPEASKTLHRVFKQKKKLRFESIWTELNQEDPMTKRWQQFHWVLSPELAHYVHSRPVMHWGYQQGLEVKQEPIDEEEVW